MDLHNKLNTLVSQPHVPRRSLLELRRVEGYSILAARRVTTRFGEAVSVEFVGEGGETEMTFLPKRFSLALTDEEVTDLAGPNTYRFRCLGKSGSAYDVKIWKA